MTPKLIRSEPIYLIVRTHGLRSRLLSDTDYDSLLKARRAEDIASILSMTDYAQDVADLPLTGIPFARLEAHRLENIFYRKLAERLSFVVNIASNGVKETLKAFSRRIEVELIRRIIRLKHGGEPVDPGILIELPMNIRTVDLKAMAEAEDLEAAIALLDHTVYQNVLNYLPAYRGARNPVVVEAGLESVYYELLWETLTRIPDRESIASLVGYEIDLRNIVRSIAFKRAGLDWVVIRRCLVRVGSRLEEPILATLASSEKLVPEILFETGYSSFAKEIADLAARGALSEIEVLAASRLYRYAVRLAKREPTRLSYVFAYLYMCEREARNLVTIVFGKKFGLPEATIRRLLI